MVRFFVTLACMVALTSAVSADTVFIYVNGRAAAGTDTSAVANAGKNAEVLRLAVEQGIMESLFDAGHIVSNITPRSSSAVGGAYTESWAKEEQSAVSIARSGGAEKLICALLTYSVNAEKVVPISVSYSLRRLDSAGATSVSKTLGVGSITKGPKDDNATMCLKMGKSVASSLLAEW